MLKRGLRNKYSSTKSQSVKIELTFYKFTLYPNTNRQPDTHRWEKPTVNEEHLEFSGEEHTASNVPRRNFSSYPVVKENYIEMTAEFEVRRKAYTIIKNEIPKSIAVGPYYF
jgi:hypothetical protein